MAIVVRELTQDDAEQARILGAGIFGTPPPPFTVQPGLTWFGAFDDGRLVAQAIDREYESWFGGIAVPTSGIAYVGVSSDHRGRGLVGLVLDAARMSAIDRGALISTLFPAAPRVYRGLGYERITDQIFVRIRREDLVGVAKSATVSTRPATAADGPDIRAIYAEWAKHQNGPLTRTGPLFAGLDLPEATLALDAEGRPKGFASHRSDRSGVTVLDLIALDADACRALLSQLANLGATSLRTSGDDPVRLLLPTSEWEITSSTPYMLRVLQIDAALSQRTYAPGTAAELTFRVDGEGHQLSVRDGGGQCQPADIPGARTFTAQGLATVYAGSQSCANLRFTGNLLGGEIDDDPTWDALFGGRQVHIRDYF